MENKKKRLLSVVLAFMLAFGMMPVQGAASPMEVTFVDAPDQADAYTTTPGALAVPVTVAAFDEICEWTLFQGYDFGKITEEELDLPTVLTGTCVDGYAVTIAGVTWQSNPPFDPWYSAMYMFASVLPMGYELAEGVNPPVISVLIRPEDGIDIDALTSAANLASQINNFQHGGMGFLDASRFGNVIYVEGHVTGTTGDMRFNDHRRSLNLDIRPGVIVVWLAHFEGVSSVAGGMTHPLIRLTGPGGGELIMQDDAAIIATQRQAIVIDRGSTTTLRAEGNSLIQGDSIAVWAHNGYAHVILAESARVQSNITGLQAIRNLSVYDNASIIATQPIVNTTAGAAGPANIHISGGTITATSNRPAILMRPSQTNLVISGGTIYAPNPGTATIETSASTVEISGNAHISSGNGTALETFASTIEISGNAHISSGNGTALFADRASVFSINGGTISANNGDAISISVSDTGGYMIINDGTISANGGCAIRSISGGINFTINGGTISSTDSTLGAINFNQPASTLTVNGGAITSNSSVGTLLTLGTVSVSGTGCVINTGAGSAIDARNDVTANTVNITGGVVAARQGFAIRTSGQGSVNITGGVVFAYGTNATGANSDVIGVANPANFTPPGANGVIIAWNQAAGRSLYELGTSLDLVSFPAGLASWRMENPTAQESDAIISTPRGSKPLAGVRVQEAMMLYIYSEDNANFPAGAPSTFQVRAFRAAGRARTGHRVLAPDLH